MTRGHGSPHGAKPAEHVIAAQRPHPAGSPPKRAVGPARPPPRSHPRGRAGLGSKRSPTRSNTDTAAFVISQFPLAIGNMPHKHRRGVGDSAHEKA